MGRFSQFRWSKTEKILTFSDFYNFYNYIFLFLIFARKSVSFIVFNFWKWHCTCIRHISFFNARILTRKFDYYYLFLAWSKALIIYILPKIDFLKILQHKKKSNSNENHQVVWKKKFFHKSELHICNRWQMKDDLQLCGGWHLMLPNRGGGQKYTIKIL